MRLRTITATAAVVMVAGLGLTACSSNNGDKAASTNDSTTSASPGTAVSGEAAKSATGAAASTAKGSTTGGKSGKRGTGTGGTGGGTVAACTTKTTKAQFVASATHASESEPAAATIKITNISGRTCTIVGASSLTAKDDQNKADPIEADNSRGGTDAVDLKPGATATATVLYTDLNFDGSPSGREVCAVQASKVQIALPKDVARTVQVTKANGASGVFSVCRPEVKFEGFTL
ncbi:DUF4232 domain-containing protein [Streptomyces sp. NPDC005202]|uniref:DUF4232 domain-containing protein n=1 Tax=Streptomyces sp. NPDC005202 TaxID=3157021 RepID=UPI0033BDB4FC